MSGEEISKMLEQIARTPPEVVNRVKAAYEAR